MVQICEDFLLNGVCHRDGCTASHNHHSCQACRVFYNYEDELTSHNESFIHRVRVLQREKKKTGLSQPVKCTVCSLALTNVMAYTSHAKGQRHQMALRSQDLNNKSDPGPEEHDLLPGTTRCETCDAVIPTQHWERHVQGPRHRNAQSFVALKGALDEADRDKNGIVISEGEGGVDFGILEIESKAEKYAKKVSVQNTNPTSINIINVSLSSSHQANRTSATRFVLRGLPRRQTIAAGQAVELTVNFYHPGFHGRGRFEDRIELVFEDPTLKQKFAITRAVRAIIGVKADYEALKATAPYVRPKRRVDAAIVDFVPGIPPPALGEMTWRVSLLLYPIPKGLTEIAYGNGSPTQIADRVRNTFLPKTLNNQTYGRHFSVLLWVEEERARRDLERYNLEDVTLEPRHPYYRLEVEGLAEKRPSIIVSDRILVRNHSSRKERGFEGHVHHVQEKSVDLLFHGSFNSYKGNRYDVQFTLNRLVFRRMHQALTTAFTTAHVLFPSSAHIASLRPPTAAQRAAIRPVDKKIGDNPPQLQAVATILHRPPGSVPFVVFGPPGTGKTVTIVEAIRQILLENPDARILACAPSNSAADIIAERLAVGLTKTDLFRLNAYSLDKRHVPAKVLEFTLTGKDGRFAVPPVQTFLRYRVIVSTCVSASIPYGIGVPRGHFTHIFIDEAGQAQEPEVMIPIKSMADNKTNVILSGDSKQLGPIVRSPVAKELGLDKSYLDRLMANPIYDEETGRGKTLVKLIKNWRSHPSILKFPNEEFYKGELEACGDPVVTHSCLRWDGLVKTNFPVIFHGISGRDEREASSPSFFNIDEASLVKRYVQDLFEDRRLRLTPQDIGVISPYNAQVHKIRNLLFTNQKRRGTSSDAKIKVGSVEEFQGQERRVIIVSTVRSSMDFINFDLRHTLGFVANPRRFNVAITRAQALLIIIGDPLVLSLDPQWKSFINYVYLQGGYTGEKIDWDPNDVVDRSVPFDDGRRERARTEREELVARIRGHTEDLTGRDDDDELEGNVDKPWREDE